MLRLLPVKKREALANEDIVFGRIIEPLILAVQVKL